MSLETSAPGGGEGTVAPITVVTPASDKPILNFREAAQQVAAFRRKQTEQPEVPAVAQESEAVEPPHELADEANAAPPEVEVPGETQEAEPAEQQSPIEPPRSWTKEEKERFKSLPRETQEYLAAREQDRERTVRQSQNEAAEQRKALETEKSAVAQARQQYEAALPALLQTLQQQQAGEFSDIKTLEDAQRLAREDWPRYALWDVQQKQIAALQHEAQAAQQRQAAEYQQQWATFAQKEDQMLLDKAPELADGEKAGKLREAALNALRENFKDDELGKLWNGQASLSLRDHRVQLLIMDAVKYREAQKAAKHAVAKPVAPVQRPGVAPQKGQAHQEVIQNLNKKLDSSGSLKDAARLLAARRQATRR